MTSSIVESTQLPTAAHHVSRAAIGSGSDCYSTWAAASRAYDRGGLAGTSACPDMESTTGNGNASDVIAAYLDAHLGLRHRGLMESIVLSVIYGVILVTGVVGNVSTCLVVAINGHMHTATNYYLFSLAVSDVLTLILGLPPELYTIWEAYPWRLGEAYCLFKTFLTEMTASASILTITAFTVERYVAICHPLSTRALCTLSRAVKTIAAVWVTAGLAALPYPLNTKTYHYLNYPDQAGIPIAESLVCNIPQEWQPRMRYVLQIYTFLLFVLPVLLITWLYALIALELRRSRGVNNFLEMTTASSVGPVTSSASQHANTTMTSTGSRAHYCGQYTSATSAPRKSIVNMLGKKR